MFGLDRLGATLAIAAAVALGGWLYGESRYSDGAAAERSSWVKVVNEKNAVISELNDRLGREFSENDGAWAAASERAASFDLPAMPPELAKQCSLPAAVVRELNLIGRAR